MLKNKNVLQIGSALALSTRLLLFLHIQKVSNYFPKILTLAEGEAAWCASEGSHRQGGCVGQRGRDTGDEKEIL